MHAYTHFLAHLLVRDLSHSEYHPSLHLFWQSIHSLNTDISSSADLTCFATKNTLLLPHLKQVYNEFSMVSSDFSSCRFIFSQAESKTGCSKVGTIFIFNFFSLYQKIKTPEKHPGRVAQGHKLAALVKKRKEEILCNKEVYTAAHRTVYTTVYTTVYSTVYTTVYSTVKWYLCLWR